MNKRLEDRIKTARGEFWYNAIKCSDGYVIVSHFTPKLRQKSCHTTEEGEEYVISGGDLELIRDTSADYEELSFTYSAPHEEIREKFHWGTYGPNGDQPLEQKKLKDLSDNHIERILEMFYEDPQSAYYRCFFASEVRFRLKKLMNKEKKEMDKTIYQQLADERNISRKAKEKHRAAFLSLVLSDIQRRAEKMGCKANPTDEASIKELKVYVKRYETESLIRGLTKEQAIELVIIESFLPEEATESQILDVIWKTHPTSMKDIGKVMKKLKEKYGDNYDGKLASSLCKQYFE